MSHQGDADSLPAMLRHDESLHDVTDATGSAPQAPFESTGEVPDEPFFPQGDKDSDAGLLEHSREHAAR